MHENKEIPRRTRICLSTKECIPARATSGIMVCASHCTTHIEFDLEKWTRCWRWSCRMQSDSPFQCARFAQTRDLPPEKYTSKRRESIEINEYSHRVASRTRAPPYTHVRAHSCECRKQGTTGMHLHNFVVLPKTAEDSSPVVCRDGAATIDSGIGKMTSTFSPCPCGKETGSKST